MLSEYRRRARRRLLIMGVTVFLSVFGAGVLIPNVGPHLVNMAENALSGGGDKHSDDPGHGSTEIATAGGRASGYDGSQTGRVDDAPARQGQRDNAEAIDLGEDRPATASERGAANRFTCTVTGVHDGDGPIYCAEGPKIRLAAIAARELDDTCRPGHPCPDASGAAARDELERLALGKTLTCDATGTSYSRTTAWCWTADGTELNCAMVEGGYALRWERFDPDGQLCR